MKTTKPDLAPLAPVAPLSHDEPVSYERISRLAYELWETYGRPDGRELEFWFEAERQLKLPSVQAAAKIPAPVPVRKVRGKLADSVDGVGGKTDDLLGHTGSAGTPSPTSLDLGPR